jgi:membrane associated rhomboid family serine protease
MFPIRDHNPSGRFPVITYLLIAINTFVTVYMLGLSPSALDTFVTQYALIPAVITSGQNLVSLFTAMFLHAGLGHLISNMLFLHIFGDNLEDTLGHLKFLIFYFICGLGAAVLQILFSPGSQIPMLGASGAIAGVMGGYLVLFPRNKIDVLLVFGLFIRRTTVPAYFMLFYWFAFQLLFGATSLAAMTGEMGGIAYFAHVGGFATGWLLVKLTGFKE